MRRVRRIQFVCRASYFPPDFSQAFDTTANTIIKDPTCPQIINRCSYVSRRNEAGSVLLEHAEAATELRPDSKCLQRNGAFKLCLGTLPRNATRGWLAGIQALAASEPSICPTYNRLLPSHGQVGAVLQRLAGRNDELPKTAHPSFLTDSSSRNILEARHFVTTGRNCATDFTGPTLGVLKQGKLVSIGDQS